MIKIIENNNMFGHLFLLHFFLCENVAKRTRNDNGDEEQHIGGDMKEMA